MNKLTWWKVAGAAAGVLVASAIGVAGYVAVDGIPRYTARPPALSIEVTPARVERGKKLSTLLCAECHADERTGRLVGKHLPEMPTQFGEVWSKNITRHPRAGIGAWTDGGLAYFLRTGVRPDGQYVPPWMPKMPQMSDEDLASIIAYLRSDDPAVAASDAVPAGTSHPSFLSKVLTHTVMKPLPFPTAPIVAPPRTDRVAFGRYLVVALDCYQCHSADFVKNDPMVPERSEGYLGGGNTVQGADGKAILTANLTADDETGIGRWSEADFTRAVRRGFRPDGRVLRYPMLPRPELDDDEAGAIYAYLRSVPKLHHAVVRPPAAAPVRPETGGDEVARGGAGRRLYAQYCTGCHGDRGVGMGGLADLRQANEHYPDDAGLRAWIEDAPSIKPSTRMPRWKEVLADADYPPLVGYVRSLAGPREASNAAPH
jgi:mono/diheme cytochrome c family protein